MVAWQRDRELRTWAERLSACVGILGVLGVIAWHAHLLAFVQPIPGGATQKINTAVCLACVGFAIVARSRARRGPVLALSSVVATIGILTLLEHATGRSLGIDSFLAPRGFAPDVTRMSVNSAMTFALLGTLLVLSVTWRSRRLASLVGIGGCLVAAVGLLALMGYVVDLPKAYSWHGLSQMAVTTASEFVALGVALVLVVLEETRREDVGVPGWPVVGTAMAMALLMLGLLHALRTRQVMSQTHANDLVVRAVARQCEMAIDDHVRAMRRQASRWHRRVPTRGEWEADSRLYLTDTQLPPSLHMIDTTGAVRWRVLLASEPEVDLRAVAHAAMSQPGFERARRDIRPLFVGPMRFGQDAAGFFVAVPLTHEGVTDGLHVGAFDMSRFVDRLPDPLLRDYAITVRTGDSVWVVRGRAARTNLPSSEATVSVGDMRWVIRFAPRRGADMALAWVFAFMGLVIAGLLAFFVHTSHNARRRSRQLERMIESSPVGMVLTDQAGQVVLANATACRLMGYSEPELLGKPVEIFVPGARREYHVEARNRFIATARATASAAPPSRWTRSGRTARACCWSWVNTLRLDRGHFVLAILTDLSARREAQRHLRERTELARSNHDLEQFAYAASHDLRAPLRAVEHLSQWLVEDLESHMNEEQKQHATLLRQRLQRMERLLTDLLEYSRVTRVHQNVEPVNVDVLVRDVAGMFEWPKGFTFRIEGVLPVLETNRSALHRSFANLVGNAIKHHDRSDGTVTVGAVDLGEYVEFHVTDDGPGIDPRFHAKAFEMFQTLRPRDEVEGSGMGLALVKRLVESHGGGIEIQSAGGRGSTIRFTWPRRWDGRTAA